MARIRALGVLVEIEAPAEALDAPGRIDDALLPGEKRVTLRADVDAQRRLGAADLKAIATGARYRGLDIVGMDASLHWGLSWRADLARLRVIVRLTAIRAARTHLLYHMPWVR